MSFLPCFTQERVREEENEEKQRQRRASRKVARAQDRSASIRRARKCEVRRRSREGRSGKKMPVSLGAGHRDSGEPATGKTQRGRNWSSARRTCAKARVSNSNRGERGSRRAGSAWHPGGNARELVPGDRSTSRAVSHRGDSTLGSGVWFAKLHTSDSASRSQAAKVRAEGSGDGAGAARARPRGARPTATKERDGTWLGAQNAWRGAEAGLWEPSSRTAKRRSWRTTYTSPSGMDTSHCGVAEEELDAGRTTRPA